MLVKMALKRIVFCEVVCACLVFVIGAQLPKYFNKCRKDSPELESCVAKSGNEAMQYLADGNNNIRFPSLKPLKVTYMKVDVGDGLKLNLTNSEIFGIEKLYIENVKINLETKKYDFRISIPKLEHVGEYDISGRIFLLPIYGHGPINATFINPKIRFSFDFDVQEIKGKGYMVPKNSKYIWKVERAYFKMDNLFDGNEILSKEMNVFLDENWKEVQEEIGGPLGDVIGELLIEIIKGFTLRVPFEEMFANVPNKSP